MTRLETIAAGQQSLPVSLDDVVAARGRIKGAVVHTPTLLSKTLSALTGAQVYLKFENQQFTAAYKERGALNRLLILPPEARARGVGGQSRAGPGRSRRTAERACHPRHAAPRATGEGDADRGAWRDGRPAW